jgi:hypothetical protein
MEQETVTGPFPGGNMFHAWNMHADVAEQVHALMGYPSRTGSGLVLRHNQEHIVNF